MTRDVAFFRVAKSVILVEINLPSASSARHAG
jgi:hypothetical protein